MERAQSCSCSSFNSETQQSLSEVEFERGIWNAAIFNETERIKSFIAKGKTNDRDNFGYTALHYSARNGHMEICKILVLDGQANINAITKGGATALHRASMMGHLEVIIFLIESNAKVDTQDWDGKTALHRAAQKGHYKVCEYLLKNCSGLEKIKDKKGNTAYDLISSTNTELKLLFKP